MTNSAEIRKENKKAIYRFMLDGGMHTKNQVSKGTGLSVATCNNLLNELNTRGIVFTGERVFGDVGRSSALYQINDNHEYYIAIHISVINEKRVGETLVFSATGKIVYRKNFSFDSISYSDIELMIESAVNTNSERNFTQIIAGVPGMVVDGVIDYCDAPELEKINLVEKLEQRFSLKTTVMNDMHIKALGYSHIANDEDVITLIYFPKNVLPGAATIHKGNLVLGNNNFAGMTGFLPYGVSREDQLKLLEPETCVPFITMSLSAIIVLLNPGTVVFTGELITDRVINEVTENCKRNIPREFIPKIEISENFDDYYYEGMFRLALDNKIF